MFIHTIAWIRSPVATMADDGDKLDSILDEIVDAKCKLRDLKVAEKEANDAAMKITESYNE